ncbi:MAG: hypothetical protein U9N59_03520 [Campylobacterota bacterium]|nr:hypothetical protein [Campylobacterota bacterium]
MKNLIILFLIVNLYANDADKMFWDEVKNSNDIELLELYKKNYPNGLFESLANIKIKRLKKANRIVKDKNKIPNWLKGDCQDYKYYGVGKANKHFKGKDYQENLARNRAQRNLQDKLNDFSLTNEEIFKYRELIQTEKYIDKKGRVYILLFIDNYDL